MMVHWDRKAFKRRLVLQIGVVLIMTLIIAVTYNHKRTGLDRDPKPLILINKEIIGLKEISGMAAFTENGETEVAIIGDDKAKIYLKRENRDYSFKDIMVERFSLCQTEDFDECAKAIKKLVKNWEALAIDGAHSFFALQEHSQSVVVLDRAVTAVQHVLHFNFGDAFTEAMANGSRKMKKNALGEGLVLLKNGHILVAKENFPVSLVEFGPEGDKALGVSPETVLGPDEAFDFRDQGFHVRLVPLNTWLLAAHGKCDISDLTLDKDFSLLALSEDCLTIQRYAGLTPGKEVELAEVYVLPGEIRSPEALVVVGNEWIVGSDVASKKQYNLYRLEAESVLR